MTSMQEFGRHLQEIGKTALDGLLRNELSFPENVFRRCMEAVDTGCKVGVISREKRVAPKQNRAKCGEWEVDNDGSVSAQVIPGILGWHVSRLSLYDLSRSEFDRIIDETVLPRAEEFRYVLYFTVLQWQKPEHEHNGKTTETWKGSNTHASTELLRVRHSTSYESSSRWSRWTESTTGIPRQHLLSLHHDNRGEDSKDIDTNLVVDIRLREPWWRDSCHRKQTSTVRWQEDLTISEDKPSKSTHTVLVHIFIRKEMWVTQTLPMILVNRQQVHTSICVI